VATVGLLSVVAFVVVVVFAGSMQRWSQVGWFWSSTQ